MIETKKYKFVIGILVLVNVLIIAFWWFFYTPSHRDDDTKRSVNRRGQHRDFMEQALKLDEDQKLAFKKLSDDHRNLLFNLNNEVDVLKQEIGSQIVKGADDQKRIDSLFFNIAIKRAAVDTTIYHHFKRLRQLCRTEQVPAFDSIMTEFLTHKERGPGMRRGMSVPPDGGREVRRQ